MAYTAEERRARRRAAYHTSLTDEKKAQMRAAYHARMARIRLNPVAIKRHNQQRLKTVRAWLARNPTFVRDRARRRRADPIKYAKFKEYKRAWNKANHATPEYRRRHNTYIKSWRAERTDRRRSLNVALRDAEQAYKMSFGVQQRVVWRRTIVELIEKIKRLR